MKKLLTIMAVCLLTLPSFAQHDSTPLSVRDVYQDLKSGFTQFVGTLEGPAKHTYHVYVQQYQIEGWARITLSLALILAGIIMMPLCWKRSTYNEAINLYGIMFIISLIGFVLGMGFLINAFVDNAVAKALNPEYFAIDKIITTFHK